MADPNPYAQWAPNPYAGFRPVGNPDPKKPLEIQRAQQEVVGGDIKNTKDAATQAADIRRANAEAVSAEVKAQQDRINADAAQGNIPGDRSLTGAAYLATLPQGMADRIVAMYQGRVGVPLNPRNPSDRLLSEAATHAFPDFDATKFNARLAAIKNVATGALGKSSNAIDTAIGHAGMLYDQAGGVAGHNGIPGMPFTGPIINHVENAWESGSPGLNLYRDTLSKLGPEEAKAYGAGTAGERGGMEAILGENLPLDTKRATIRNALELFASKEAANAHQFDWGNMGNAKPSLDLLDPHARATLQRIAPDLLEKYFSPSHDPMLVATGAFPGGPHNGGPGNDGGIGGDGTPPPSNSPPGLPPANSPGPSDPSPLPAQGSGPLGLGAASRTLDHPRIRSMVASLINAGADYATVNSAIPAGFPKIPLTQWGAVKNWMKANPGQQYPASAIDAHTTEPLTLQQRAASSGLGTLAATMSNSALAGIPAYLAGPEGAGAIDAMDKLHGNWATAGNLAGGLEAAAGGELGALKAAGKFAPAFTKYAPRLADAMYGGVSGYTGSGGDLGSAAEGALIAPLAGFAGEKGMKVVGGAVKGVTDPAVQYLNSLGIPLTVGQALAKAGTFGNAVKGLEDAGTSIPGVGAVINARRTEGLQGFNRAAFDVGAAPTGQTVQDYGANGLQKLAQIKSDAYSSALDPVTINANSPGFVGDVGATVDAARGIPNVNGAQDAALAALRSRIGGAIDPATDLMTGRGFQEAYRGLARTGRERAAGDYGHEVGQVMRQGQDALAGALEDQNPGAYQGFLDANATNRRMNILATALGSAKNQEGALFTPAQINSADFANAANLVGKPAAAMGDRPFADLATAGQAVLPSKVPDSGTITRGMVGLAATGAGLGGATGYATGDTGTGAEMGLGSILALAIGGSKPAQHILTAAILNRPDAARIVGAGLQRYAQVGGAAGAGLGIADLTGQ